MNYLPKKLNATAIIAVFAYQLVFPQFSYASVLDNFISQDSILAIVNSPQAMIFDASSVELSTKLPVSTLRKAHRKVQVSVTAYSSTPDQTDSTPFTTANGSQVRDGIVATNFLPFGTKVRIPELFGDKVFSVEDRMNARYYYKIDVWLPTYEAAKNFGIRYVEVEVF